MKDSYPCSATESRLQDFSETKAETQQLLLERIVSIIPVPYYWGWVIFSGIIFLCTSFAVFYLEKSFSYILTLFILSILLAQQSIIVIWAHKKMNLLRDYLLDIIDLPRDWVLRWYGEQMAIIFNEKRMFGLGVLINIIFYLLGANDYGFTFKSSYSYLILYTDYYITHFLVGAGLYPLFFTALTVYKIRKLPLSVNILLSKNLQIKRLLYSKFTICATSVYASWGIFSLSTPNSLFAGPRLIVYSFFALLLIAYFIIPQYSIHQMIMKTKKEKLKTFSKQLMDNAKEAFTIPTKENISSLRNFLDIEHQLDEMCVWPFGSYELLHIVLIVIIPLVVVLLEIQFGIVK